MEWLSDPTVWVGLLTLVVLEIVLGIDNLIFIAILADKLPPSERDRARVIGLSLALIMRLALLSVISWVMSLTAPLFEIGRFVFSWRDLILIGGGLFLIVKATTEMHERLDARQAAHGAAAPAHAAFWPIIAQIVILDAVFSLDSVITAVGMVDELPVMMAAVIIAVLAMLFASKPLTAFVIARPSLIILCLGFLLMIGLVLVVDGFGLHVPKGYVYAAIGFSVLIEALNQLGAHNRRRVAVALPPRQRVADTVLRMLGGVPIAGLGGVPSPGDASEPSLQEVFRPMERHMVRGVLGLAERPVTAVMTPRTEVVWLDLLAKPDEALSRLRASSHREFPVGRGSLDEIEGSARKEDVFALRLDGKPLDLASVLREPLVVHEGASVLDTLNLFKRSAAELAIVLDGYGSLLGVVTPVNLLEAIAGDLAASDTEPNVRLLEDGSLSINGSTPTHELQERLTLRRMPEGGYDTAAGLLLALFERIPAVGERAEWEGWSFEVAKVENSRISRLIARRSAKDGARQHR